MIYVCVLLFSLVLVVGFGVGVRRKFAGLFGFGCCVWLFALWVGGFCWFCGC